MVKPLNLLSDNSTVPFAEIAMQWYSEMLASIHV